MTTSRPIMFHELAEYYDEFMAEKDYRGEVRRLEALARRYGRSRGRAWLDVGCGTGRHLALLRARHPVAGVDNSLSMLRIARRRLPGVRLVLADMRSFRLDRSFDVVSCLFSAVGHLRTEQDLLATFANFARHLKPGGVALVEPWLDPAEFRPAMLHLMTHEGPSVTVVRLAYSSRRGRRSVIHSHYLIGRLGTGVRHFTDTDVGLLVPHQRLLALMKKCGLRPTFLKAGVRPGRGLLVGVKGPTPAAGRGR